jgi:predicted DNA-binding protein (UPF0251 family)
MTEPRKRGRTPALTLRDKFELRQLRESGVEVTEAAAYLGVSRATALRALAELREKLGPEKLPNGQRARSYLRRLDFQLNK